MGDPEPFVPKLEVVRKLYADIRDRHYYSPSLEQAKRYRETGGGEGEFDRWLAGHDAEQREAGRLAALEEAEPRVRQVLTDWGMNDGGNPHSWRCEHPDRFKACTCADEIAADIIAALRPSSPYRADQNGDE